MRQSNARLRWWQPPLLVGALTCAGCGDEHPDALTNDPLDASATRDVQGRVDVGDTGGGLPPRAASSYPAYDVTMVLPFRGPAQTLELAVEPRAGRLDVMLSIDTTGSFMGEINNLKSTLNSTIIPGLRARVSDLAMGVARFADFPVAPYGRTTDRTYDLLTPITADLSAVTRGVGALELQNGGDPPEAWAEALFQIATGAGLNGVSVATGNIAPFTPPAGTVPGSQPGGVGFRAGAARVVINVTDAPAHEPDDYALRIAGTHSTAQAAEAMRRVGARLIGIASGEAARPQMEAIALATGAVVPPTGGGCPTGVAHATRAPLRGTCPLVFDIDDNGSGLGDTLVDAILRFLDSLAFGAVSGATLGDDRRFVQSIEAVSAQVSTGTAQPVREDRAPAGMLDGVPDTFLDVLTRTRLTFRANVRNTQVPQTDFPQLFFVTVQILGDGVVVDTRTIRIIVPEGPKPDAGLDVLDASEVAD